MDFTLTIRPSPMCFEVRNLEGFADWLQQPPRSYQPIERHGQHEYMRLYKDGAICIIYNSGSVLAQGVQWRRLANCLAAKAQQQAASLESALHV